LHVARELRERLALLRADLAAGAEDFRRAHGDLMQDYRRQISSGIQETLQGFRDDLGRLSGDNLLCRRLADSTADYVDWFQWALWDLPVFAVALRPEREPFRRAVASCGMVYLSIRLFDDVVDRHFLYKGKRRTLLASLTDLPEGGRASALTQLAGVLLCLHGILALTGNGDGGALLGQEDSRRMLERVVASARRVLVGLILELSAPDSWDDTSYERLVELKNVDYSRILYAALDPGDRSPLAPFLGRYYALAQRLNDVEDHPQDEQRGQPNLVSLLRARSTVAAPREDAWREVEAIVGGEFLDLGARADELPALERGVARLKLHESLEAAFGLGLFQPAAKTASEGRPAGAESQPAGAESRPPGVTAAASAASRVEEILERLGPGALEAVACGACGEAGGKELFRKQGFVVRRCPDCSHVYVSPRLAGGLAPPAGENDPGLVPFFAAERLYAAVVCDLVGEHCEGRRWLHYGLGGGHLLREAMARGAQVYAADESPHALEALRPVLGRRLWQVGRPPGELPWGPHDAVLLQHTAELFRAPHDALERASRALRPGGLLYLAVPDVDSLQLRMLGRHWEAVSPVLRWHYFGRESLERVLTDCGFAVVEWIDHPPAPASLAAPWMQLFRRLGCPEAGELAVLARRTSRD
jgi:SAM-dependent methyltransferase